MLLFSPGARPRQAKINESSLSLSARVNKRGFAAARAREEDDEGGGRKKRQKRKKSIERKREREKEG